MSEQQKAECRALGALDNFRHEMAEKLAREGRSPEYIAAFWDNFRNVCFDFAVSKEA